MSPAVKFLQEIGYGLEAAKKQLESNSFQSILRVDKEKAVQSLRTASESTAPYYEMLIKKIDGALIDLNAFGKDFMEDRAGMIVKHKSPPVKIPRARPPLVVLESRGGYMDSRLVDMLESEYREAQKFLPGSLIQNDSDEMRKLLNIGSKNKGKISDAFKSAVQKVKNIASQSAKAMNDASITARIAHTTKVVEDVEDMDDARSVHFGFYGSDKGLKVPLGGNPFSSAKGGSTEQNAYRAVGGATHNVLKARYDYLKWAKEHPIGDMAVKLVPIVASTMVYSAQQKSAAKKTLQEWGIKNPTAKQLEDYLENEYDQEEFLEKWGVKRKSEASPALNPGRARNIGETIGAAGDKIKSKLGDIWRQSGRGVRDGSVSGVTSAIPGELGFKAHTAVYGGSSPHIPLGGNPFKGGPEAQDSVYRKVGNVAHNVASGATKSAIWAYKNPIKVGVASLVLGKASVEMIYKRFGKELQDLGVKKPTKNQIEEYMEDPVAWKDNYTKNFHKDSYKKKQGIDPNFKYSPDYKYKMDDSKLGRTAGGVYSGANLGAGVGIGGSVVALSYALNKPASSTDVISDVLLGTSNVREKRAKAVMGVLKAAPKIIGAGAVIGGVLGGKFGSNSWTKEKAEKELIRKKDQEEGIK